jgi:hypothetical protein
VAEAASFGRVGFVIAKIETGKAGSFPHAKLTFAAANGRPIAIPSSFAGG